MRSVLRCTMWLLFAVVSGCGAKHVYTPLTSPDASPVLRMRHQILFSRGDDVQVFEGYMVASGEAFIVKAFAGPGVDLFTVVRDGERARNTLHLSALSDRIDVNRVGADIARVYLAGCEGTAAAAGGERSCLFYGEPLIEVRDTGGQLLSRRFPEAHGIGLTVTYEAYAPFGKQRLPKQITLSWGTSGNRMIIRLVEVKVVEDFPADEIEKALAP